MPFRSPLNPRPRLAQARRHRSARAALLAIGLGLALLSCGVTDLPAQPATAGRPHHTAEGFRNRYDGELDPSGFWRWQWERLGRDLPPAPTTDLSPVPADVEGIRARRQGVAVTWIGHSTVLLQLDGLNILSDPHFGARASPVSFAGPKRHQPPGLRLDQLPRIDVVLISHNHYDHLDHGSVSALMRQPGGPPLFLVPLGVDRWFAAEVPGTRLDGPQANVRALDWDEHVRIDARQGPVDLRFLAVQHWSSRTPWDRNRTLWGSWAVLHPQFRYWFSGDLGYSKDTQDIGRQWGPFDFAAIAVGAYEPRWFMKRQHVNPAEAVQVMEDIGARAAFGIHWGTFALTDEALDQAPRDLAAAVAARGWSPERFTVMRHGQTRVLRP